jgi:hypothetical protein
MRRQGELHEKMEGIRGQTPASNLNSAKLLLKEKWQERRQGLYNFYS